ncbi:MAG: hypothetical protein KDD12_24455 [Lewinella sp.]|nr:hypothetical protein [Lewinella sp.]
MNQTHKWTDFVAYAGGVGVSISSFLQEHWAVFTLAVPWLIGVISKAWFLRQEYRQREEKHQAEMEKLKRS